MDLTFVFLRKIKSVSIIHLHVSDFRITDVALYNVTQL